MELEFDKVMDALLRRSKSRDVTSASLTTLSATISHLDADEIAAFAEYALPASSRLAYTQHLGDCASCRKQLAFAASLNGAAATPDAVGSVAPVNISATAWYRRFFSTPSLAAAFGALILAFSGVLGYLVVKQGDGGNVAAVFETSSSNTAANRVADLSDSTVVSPTVNAAAANTSSSAPSPLAENKSLGREAFANSNSAVRKEGFSADGAQAPPPKSVAAAPPPPMATPAEPTMADAPTVDATAGITTEDRRDEKDDAAERDRQQNRNRDLLLSSPKRKTGPSRAQTQAQSSEGYAAVSRRVGDKTFLRRDGAWYDSAYSGGPTTEVRRGSEAFRKLDDGLRDIANSLDGVVVVVWKSKPYRIQ